jgi:signal transduction histidine kinase
MSSTFDKAQWRALMRTMGNTARAIEPMTKAMISAQRSSMQTLVEWQQSALKTMAQQANPDAREPINEASRRIMMASVNFSETCDELGTQLTDAQHRLVSSWLTTLDQMMDDVDDDGDDVDGDGS